MKLFLVMSILLAVSTVVSAKDLSSQGNKPSTEKLYRLRESLGCDGRTAYSYMVTYGNVVEAYNRAIDANSELFKLQTNDISVAMDNDDSLRGELIQIKRDHDSKMNELMKSCRE